MIDRIISDEAYEAGENANNASGVNPFATQNELAAIAPQNALVSGGATWNSLLIFDVTALTYWLNGVFYSSVATQVTLGAADPTDPRIDVIVVDAVGVVSVIAGTPAPSPVKPEVDTSIYVEVTFIQVDAGATTPSISIENLYLEDTGSPGEWVATDNSANIDLASAVDPYDGTVSIEGTAVVNGNRVNLIKVTPYTINLTSVLELKVKLKAAIGNNERLRLRFRNGGSAVGVNVDIRNGRYGFSASDISGYQTIAIPMSEFDVSGDVTELRIIGNNIASPIGFFMDNIRIQEGFGISIGPVDAVDVTYTPTTPGDFGVVPANVQQALDWIAANMGGGGSPVWTPPGITLGDFNTNGVTVYNAVGAGTLYTFSPNANNEVVVTIPLNHGDIPYGGEGLLFTINWQMFSIAAPGRTISGSLDYAFCNDGDDNYYKLDGTMPMLIDCDLITAGQQNTNNFGAISGPAGSKVLQLTLRRDGLVDTYNGDVDFYGAALIKV